MRATLLLTMLLMAICARAQGCMTAAALHSNIPEQVLSGIEYVESGSGGYVESGNANGSTDYCSMQINSFWLPILKSEFGITAGSLKNQCVCHLTGAWILSNEIARHGLVSGIGAYHVGSVRVSPSRAYNYFAKVLSAIGHQPTSRVAPAGETRTSH